MYSFKDLKATIEVEANQLPSVAINFNGKWLDNEIEAFRTLKVSGRETISVELDMVEVRNGTLVLDERLPHRNIVITYLMDSKSNTDFQDDFKALRKFLTSDKEIPIKFNDEPNTWYFGRLSAMETVDDDKNNVIGQFTITCPSPFKFGELQTGSTVEIETFYPTQPETLTLMVDETTNKIQIKHNGYTISATGTFNAGSKVVFYFGQEEMTMMVNGVESTYMIDLNSDFENFELKQGQSITSAQGTVTATMRERRL